MKFKKEILITGGAGFIGSHLTHYFVKKYSDYKITKIMITLEGLKNFKTIILKK